MRRRCVAAQLLGPVVMLPVTGMLSSSAGGWPSVFYASGALGLLVGLMVFVFVADSPAKHRSITEVERNYIQRSIGVNTRAQLKVREGREKKAADTEPSHRTADDH